jgi:hypothetical protein
VQGDIILPGNRNLMWAPTRIKAVALGLAARLLRLDEYAELIPGYPGDAVPVSDDPASRWLPT